MPESQAAHEIRLKLEDAARRRRQLDRRHVLARGLALALAVVLLMVLLDAIWPLPAWLRTAAISGIGIGLLLAALRAIQLGAATAATLRAARQIEQHHEVDDNALVNSVWLAPAAEHEQGLNAHLARRAVAHGQDVARQVDARAAIVHEPCRQAVRALACVVGIAVVLLLVQPSLLGVGLARLAAPFADIPPFSLTRLAVAVNPAELEHGGSATVDVELSGLLVHDVDLVEVDDNQRELRRWPMQPVEDRRFTRQLDGLREPVAFRIEAGSARSRHQVIAPAPPPTLPAVAQQSERADSPEQHASPQDPAEPEEDVQQVVAGQLAALLNEAEQIERQAAQFAAEAAEQSRPNDAAEVEALAQQLDALAEQIAAFAEAAGVLADMSDDADQQVMSQLGNRLRELRLPRSASLSSPGTGLGRGSGDPASDSRPPGEWAQQVADDAGRDARTLRPLLAEMDGDSGYRTYGLADEPAQAAPPQADGEYHEQMAASTGVDRSPEAVMRQVPASYRQMVAQYFRRIAADQVAGERQ